MNLQALKKELQRLGIRLIYKSCDTFHEGNQLILSLCKTLSVRNVYFNNEYAWDERQRDEQLCQMLSSLSIQYQSFDDQCLIPPNVIYNQQELPYRVFTPFKKACLSYVHSNPDILTVLPKPRIIQKQQDISIENDDYLEVSCSITSMPEAGYKPAHTRLQYFIEHHVVDYPQLRDIPSIDGTSKLSPYLAIGVLSVRQCLAALLLYFQGELHQILAHEGTSTWLSELLWRDFYKMICFNFPLVSRGMPFKKETIRLEWDTCDKHLSAWKEGNTGVPIVDSAMRQLNTKGWMHNRLRMIVAMYLTKNLWQDWREGEAYFASKLIDWDFASNNGGWQWCASTGADAVPYFRIFNPILQSERFDKEGKFMRHFCPELKELNHYEIHDPFKRAKKTLAYPKPIVDLALSKQYAIKQFKALK